jgi:hypothetical protein
MTTVAGLYGAIGHHRDEHPSAVPGDRRIKNGLPVRLTHTSSLFGLIGVVFIYMGLAALRLVPNPLARLYQRHPRAQLVILGGLISGFPIGRPFPLFYKLFECAPERHNPLYGAFVFILQSLGNIVILTLLFLVLIVGSIGRLEHWRAAKAGRVASVTAAASSPEGCSFVAYWAIRLPSLFGVGWSPTMPVETISEARAVYARVPRIWNDETILSRRGRTRDGSDAPGTAIEIA